ALQAWFGQAKELAATRQRILAFAKDTNDVVTAERAAKACSIRASPDKAELEAALALGRTAVKVGQGGARTLPPLARATHAGRHQAPARHRKGRPERLPRDGHCGILPGDEPISAG